MRPYLCSIIVAIFLAPSLVAQVVDGVRCDDRRQNQPMKYSDARKIAFNETRPMLVLLTLKGCAPCQALKKNTLAPMLADGELEPFVYAIVDIDEEPELAKLIQEKSAFPQLIAFGTHQAKPIHKYGSMTRIEVIEFLLKAQSPKKPDPEVRTPIGTPNPVPVESVPIKDPSSFWE